MKTNSSVIDTQTAKHFTDNIAHSASNAVEQLSSSAQNTIDKSQKLAKVGLDILQDSATLAANRARDYSVEGLDYVKARPRQSLLVLAGLGVAIYLIYALSASNTPQRVKTYPTKR